MAENSQDAGLNIEVNAVANKKSAEKAVNELASGVQQASKKGRIEVPVDITVPIDNTKKKLTEAQKDITSEISKMMAKGFSASGKDIDTLTSKFDKFVKALDTAGKGRQNKIFREIRKQVEEIQKSYKLLKAETKSAKSYTPKATNTKKSTAKDRYLEKQEQYSKRAQGAGERKELRKELDYVRENKSPIKSSSNIKASMTNEHLMRLSEYSAHGSNWANELAKTLKEEAALSAKRLTTRFDKNYKVGTEIGEKSGKIVSKKSGKATDEKTMLTDVIKKTKNELSSYIAELEAGSEEITLDMLKESAAIIKVLTRAIGKTTEDAEKTITQAIQGRYDQKQSSSKNGGRLGGTSLEEGQTKGVGPGHENTKKLIKQLNESMKQWDSEVFAEKVAEEMVLGTKQSLKTITQSDKITENVKASDMYKTELNKLNNVGEDVFKGVADTIKETEKVNRSIKIGNTKNAIEADQSEKINKENKDINRDVARVVKHDETTGFNTDTKADELINTIEQNSTVELSETTTDILQSILTQITAILSILQPEKTKQYNVAKKDKIKDVKTPTQDYSLEMKAAYAELAKPFEPIKNALIPLRNSVRISTETPKAISKSEFNKIRTKLAEEKNLPKVQKSNIFASPIKQTIWDKLEDNINSLTGATKEYEKVMNATAEKQDQFAAERITKFGLNNGRNPNDTGDIANIRRALELFRTNKRSIEENEELSQKIQLTKGVKVDTTEVTKVLNEALSGKQMRIAQMGGSIPRQILGGLTGFVGMPSLEKSRAQADGLNQILGNINKALNSVLSSIQMKETELSGLEQAGKAKFNDKGEMIEGTSAARKTFVDLEEYKLVLSSILADMKTIDTVVNSTDGKFSKLVKRLNFTSPVLRENNDILRSINAGLDKNGKALKFQTRMAEILNYTFQLMSRSIGQMFKNWLSQLGSLMNPINWIKRAFQDFGSYDPKWQRTMNVIKNNLREIILPYMEKIAQTIVNIIGFLDIISMKIQQAFGNTPISLFDQKNANDFKKTYEEIQNVTAGFDELHDIGSNTDNDPNNLLGEIYKPQLSKEWEDLANRIGDLFAGIIKGDLGFGEVMKEILGILGQTLGIIGQMIWNWFKETAIGKWIIEHWKGLLATLLTLFLGWKLLKIFGPTLLSTIGGAFKNVLSKVGGWITTLLGASGFGQGIMTAFRTLFAGGKYSLLGTLGEMFTNSAAITKAGSWGSMIGFALVKGLVGVLSIALGGKMVADAFDSAADKTSYNIGLEQAGGKDEDKKGTGWDIAKGAAGGAAIGFGIGQIIPVVGPLVGAAIGTVAGALTTALAPAFEKATVKAKEMNNEMQKIEYYEGVVQGASAQVNVFDEQLKLLKQSLDLNTQSVYDQGEKLGINKTRMDELIKATQDGSFTTDMLTGSEQGLAGSLTDLAQKQEHVTEVSKKLEDAQKKLLKAQTDLSIAQDIEAGNFEIAAARLEVAEAQGVYATEEATAKRIQLYKQGSEEERKNLLQNLTPEQRKKMLEYNATTDKELKELNKLWNDSSDEIKRIFTDSIDQETINKFDRNLNSIDSIMAEHQGFWQGVGDTIAEIFTLGNATTHTYNKDDAAYKELANRLNTGKITKDQVDENVINELRRRKLISFDVGTNYVPNDGLAYLHQGEAVIPKKYNKPYEPTGISQEERNYMSQMMSVMASLDSTIKQGINVSGEFRQRGSDLVAVTEKAKNRNGHQPLNNPIFAR